MRDQRERKLVSLGGLQKSADQFDDVLAEQIFIGRQNLVFGQRLGDPGLVDEIAPTDLSLMMSISVARVLTEIFLNLPS